MIARCLGYLLGRFGIFTVLFFLAGAAVIGFAVMPALRHGSAVVPALAQPSGHYKPVANGRPDYRGLKIGAGTGGLY
jgi:hypothetical protein